MYGVRVARSLFIAVLAAAAGIVIFGQQTRGEGIARGALSEKFSPFICTDATSGEQFAVAFTAAGDGDLMIFPFVSTAHISDGVLSADHPGGTISLNGKNFASVEKNRVTTGTCQPIGELIDTMVAYIETVDPEAFDSLAAAIALTHGTQSAEIAGLRQDLEKAQAAASPLLQEIATLRQEMATLRAAHDAAKSKADLAAQETDLLKRRICKLDPSSTYSVCKN